MSAHTHLGIFADPDRARRELETLQAALPPELVAVIVHLLRDLPNPDQALALCMRLVTAGQEYILLLDRNRVLLHHALALFGYSYWLGDALANDPDLLLFLAGDKNLEHSFGVEECREHLRNFYSRGVESDPAALLARFKKTEYVRICLRDILGIATLAETTQEISALADVILEEALRLADQALDTHWKHRLFSDADSSTRFTILSLGKLGGCELNYSSDLDLFYLFDAGEAGAGAKEYFTRLAQFVTDVLSRSTAQGSVFRIDLRLRPQGRAGEAVISLKQALDYYSINAQDWELQALIKARYSAGDERIARDFMRGVEAFVYRKDLNFGAIETAVRSREKLSSGAKLRSSVRSGTNIKLDPGGIRDIEFLVQCLQRAYGGEEKWLRSGGTLLALQRLHDKGHISGKDFHELTMAYEFLRRVEHRLQFDRGQQTQTVPSDPQRLLVLERAMRPRNDAAGSRPLPDLVTGHMRRVADIYQRIIHHHRSRKKLWILGKPAPASVHEMSFEQMLERIGHDSPEVHALISRSDIPLHARRNLHRLLASAMTDRERYGALLEKPATIKTAIVLLTRSDYLTEMFVRYPDCLRELEQAREIFPQTADEVRPLDGEEGLQHLRRVLRREMFAVAAADVLSPFLIFESLGKTSRLAETAIRRALQITGGAGKLAVFALGRLGTQEFDLLSDADLLLVRAPETDAAEARLPAERLIQALTAYTREGSMFAVDTRLRPYGGEGELVTTPGELESYLSRNAQPWEALTYTKLSFIAGNTQTATQVLPPMERRIIELAARPGFIAAVREMRERLERANRYPHSFKQARGGFYDIDFIASFLMLRHGALAEGNTLERLRHLRDRGTLPESEFDELERATFLHRTADHVIRLVTGKARPELPDA
ncbi:MAG TPA: hypothetical protein VE783_07220, partial [Candidatus Limnocylindrales bacterium]|nr:hypothetical protein [Candidatus Limnocylindrales bacterium]